MSKRYVTWSEGKFMALFNEKGNLLIGFPGLSSAQVYERLANVFPNWNDPMAVTDAQIQENHYPAPAIDDMRR